MSTEVNINNASLEEYQATLTHIVVGKRQFTKNLLEQLPIGRVIDIETGKIASGIQLWGYISMHVNCVDNNHLHTHVIYKRDGKLYHGTAYAYLIGVQKDYANAHYIDEIPLGLGSHIKEQAVSAYYDYVALDVIEKLDAGKTVPFNYLHGDKSSFEGYELDTWPFYTRVKFAKWAEDAVTAGNNLENTEENRKKYPQLRKQLLKSIDTEIGSIDDKDSFLRYIKKNLTEQYHQVVAEYEKSYETICNLEQLFIAHR